MEFCGDLWEKYAGPVGTYDQRPGPRQWVKPLGAFGSCCTGHVTCSIVDAPLDVQVEHRPFEKTLKTGFNVALEGYMKTIYLSIVLYVISFFEKKNVRVS